MEKENFKFQYIFKDKKDYQDYKKRYSKVYSEKCEDIRSGGYKIYTSINMKTQKKLQKSINEGLAYNTEKNADTGKYALHGAAVCIDNDTIPRQPLLMTISLKMVLKMQEGFIMGI